MKYKCKIIKEKITLTLYDINKINIHNMIGNEYSEENINHFKNITKESLLESNSFIWYGWSMKMPFKVKENMSPFVDEVVELDFMPTKEMKLLNTNIKSININKESEIEVFVDEIVIDKKIENFDKIKDDVNKILKEHELSSKLEKVNKKFEDTELSNKEIRIETFSWNFDWFKKLFKLK